MHPFVKSFKRSLFFISLFFAGNLFAGSYYVAVSGNNNNTGTKEQPWKTIQFAVDNVVPGDTVLVESGIYNERVTFHQSGRAGEMITLKNAANALPVLDGTGLDGNQPALIKIVDKKYIVIRGFEIRNLTSRQFASGIWVIGSAHHIEIRKNKIHHIIDPNPDGGCHGVAFYGTNADSAMHDIILDDNEIYALQLKWSEACAFNGNVRDFTVSNNRIHDVDNIAFVFIGFEGECAGCSGGVNQDRARNGLVIHNSAYNVDSKDNPPYNGERSADGFYVDGGRDIIFESNRSFQNDIGFEVASEHGGKNAAHVIVRNNFIYNNLVVGLSTGGYADNVGATDSCYFVNNSFYNNHTSTRSQDDWGAEVLLNFHIHNSVYENNIIYAAKAWPRFLSVGTDIAENSMDYNLYFGSTDGNAPGSHSIAADPMFALAEQGDLHLLKNSPAIDKGHMLPDSIRGKTDFDDKQRVVNHFIDMGADETDLPVAIGRREPLMAEKFRLFQNYPNPFNPQTVIEYALSAREKVAVTIYGVSGEKIAVLFSGIQSAGTHRIIWDGKDDRMQNVASGVYLYRVKTEEAQKSKKMLLLR